MDITIKVDDENDNAPTFQDALQFTVLEQSNPGQEREVDNSNPEVFDLQ